MTDPLQSLAQQLGVEVVGCGHEKSKDEPGWVDGVCLTDFIDPDDGIRHKADCNGIDEQATADAIREKVMGLLAVVEKASMIRGRVLLADDWLTRNHVPFGMHSTAEQIREAARIYKDPVYMAALRTPTSESEEKG